MRLSAAVRTAAALAAAAAALVLAPSPAGAQTGQTFSVRPAHYDPADPATRAYFKPVVDPGATFSDEVVVANTGDESITFHVSAVDGLTAQTTGAVYANRQDAVRRTGAWVTPAVSELTVAPRSEVSVPFSVRVPADAPPGDHLGGVAFENADPRSSGTGIRITQVVRAVVGVSIRVPGPAAFDLRVGEPRVQRMDGTGVAAVFLPLANQGRALGKPELSVTVAGPNGYRRTVERMLDTILPGDSVDYPLAWPDDLAPGRYRVTATATGPGADASSEAELELREALRGIDSSSSGTAAPTPPGHSDGTPWWVVVAAAAGALGLGLGLTLRPRRRAAAPTASRADDDVAEPRQRFGAWSFVPSESDPERAQST